VEIAAGLKVFDVSSLALIVDEELCFLAKHAGSLINSPGFIFSSRFFRKFANNNYLS
jgi:hypothetical protein